MTEGVNNALSTTVPEVVEEPAVVQDSIPSTVAKETKEAKETTEDKGTISLETFTDLLSDTAAKLNPSTIATKVTEGVNNALSTPDVTGEGSTVAKDSTPSSIFSLFNPSNIAAHLIPGEKAKESTLPTPTVKDDMLGKQAATSSTQNDVDQGLVLDDINDFLAQLDDAPLTPDMLGILMPETQASEQHSPSENKDTQVTDEILEIFGKMATAEASKTKDEVDTTIPKIVEENGEEDASFLDQISLGLFDDETSEHIPSENKDVQITEEIFEALGKMVPPTVTIAESSQKHDEVDTSAKAAKKNGEEDARDQISSETATNEVMNLSDFGSFIDESTPIVPVVKDSESKDTVDPLAMPKTTEENGEEFVAQYMLTSTEERNPHSPALYLATLDALIKEVAESTKAQREEVDQFDANGYFPADTSEQEELDELSRVMDEIGETPVGLSDQKQSESLEIEQDELDPYQLFIETVDAALGEQEVKDAETQIAPQITITSASDEMSSLNNGNLELEEFGEVVETATPVKEEKEKPSSNIVEIVEVPVTSVFENVDTATTGNVVENPVFENPHMAQKSVATPELDFFESVLEDAISPQLVRFTEVVDTAKTPMEALEYALGVDVPKHTPKQGEVIHSSAVLENPMDELRSALEATKKLDTPNISSSDSIFGKEGPHDANAIKAKLAQREFAKAKMALESSKITLEEKTLLLEKAKGNHADAEEILSKVKIAANENLPQVEKGVLESFKSTWDKINPSNVTTGLKAWMFGELSSAADAESAAKETLRRAQKALDRAKSHACHDLEILEQTDKAEVLKQLQARGLSSSEQQSKAEQVVSKHDYNNKDKGMFSFWKSKPTDLVEAEKAAKQHGEDAQKWKTHLGKIELADCAIKAWEKLSEAFKAVNETDDALHKAELAHGLALQQVNGDNDRYELAKKALAELSPVESETTLDGKLSVNKLGTSDLSHMETSEGLQTESQDGHHPSLVVMPQDLSMITSHIDQTTLFTQ